MDSQFNDIDELIEAGGRAVDDSMQLRLGQGGGEVPVRFPEVELGPEPKNDWSEITRLQEGGHTEEANALMDRFRETERAWKGGMERAIAQGQITAEEARAFGYYGGTSGGLWTGLPDPSRGFGGGPPTRDLPDRLFHVTTDAEGVRTGGFKTRAELGQQRGAGLGGGTSEAISFTGSREAAENLREVMLEARQVARNEITVDDLLEEAARGRGADGPWIEPLIRGIGVRNKDWKIGDAIPDDVRRIASEGSMEERFDFYKNFLTWRQYAGGRENPLFFSSDVEALARLDPKQIQVLEAEPLNRQIRGRFFPAMDEYRIMTGEHVRLTRIGDRAAHEGHPGSNEIARTRADLMDDHPVLGQRGERTYAARYADKDADEAVQNWDDYVESLQVRLFEITGRDPELMHAVARGRFTDGMTLDVKGTSRINRDAANRLAKNHLDQAPPVIGGDRAHEGISLGRRSYMKDDGYDRALEKMFGLLAAIPTDRLSRSPAFRQFHMRRMQELLPFMDAKSQQRFLANAGDVMKVPERGWHLRMSAYIGDAEKVTSPTMSSLRRAAEGRSGDLTLEMASDMAKSAALENTRWLLYDVHKKGKFMDAMRVIFPFGEAWKEVGTRWLALTAQRPGTVIQRATQIGEAISKPEGWEGVVDDPSQHGWVFTNATGENVFTYPAAEWLTSAMTGVPVELTGSFQGLTLMSSVTPGVGPVVQVPLSMWGYMRDSPQMEGIRNTLFPYGLGVDPRTDAGGALSDLLFSPAVQRVFQGMAAGGLEALEVPLSTPGGDQRTLSLRNTPFIPDLLRGLGSVFGGGTAPQDDRLFLNSAFDVMRYHVSTGRYNTRSVDAIDTLVQKSTKDAGLLYMIRGLAGMTLPSAPIPEFQVEGNDGNLLMLRALSDSYRQMQEEDFPNAAQNFMARYGENLDLVLQAKSVPRSAMLPVTKEADDWVQNNPGIQTDYRMSFGLWAPGNTEANQFDFEAYNRYIDRRASEVLGRELQLEDLVGLANDRTASAMARQREEELLADPRNRTEEGNLNEEAQRYLSTEYRPWLEDQYPGFGTDGLHRGPSQQDLQGVIGMPSSTESEGRRAVTDERIDAPIREALGRYIEKHDELIGILDDDPDAWGGSTTFYESSSTREMRDYLRNQYLPWLREQVPRAYRSRWDVIQERLIDRTMTPVWQEEEE